jgi:soluble cytochrome b562
MQPKFLGAIVAALAAVFLLAWKTPVTQDGHSESALHERMEDLNSTLRRVNRLVKDKQKISEAVDLVVEMEHDVLDAKGEVPPRADKLEGAVRDSFVLGYRRDMIKLLVMLTELEMACLEGNTDAAQAVVERLVSHRNASHELYQDEE